MKMKKFIAPVLGLSLLFPTMSSAAEPKATAETPAADLRAALDQLLSEHFVLAVSSMTTMYDGSKNWEAAAKALDQNAVDMEPAIASIYGDEGAAQFEKIFREHNNYTEDLVKATKEDDPEARKAAEQEVDQFVKEFSEFLGTATEGKLPTEAAAKAVRVHEDQVQDTFDAYVEGDYKEAYETYREGYKHMFVISKALSGAITTQMPEKFNDTKSDTAAADLRSTLNSLAGEHFALATMGMAKEYDGAKDFDFVSWAENANTAEFKGAVASIYGDEGAAQFEKIWQTDHIAAQSDLVQAVKNKDEDARAQVEERFNQFAEDFGGFLGAATEENLPAADATAAVKTHEEQVMKTFDSYVAGDYDAEYQNFREGYKTMFGIGLALGDAIVKQMPDKFAGTTMPEEMPKTGMGGTSDSTSTTEMMVVTFGAIAAIASAFIVRRKMTREQ
ncbi:copper amine oxidase [Peribacillus cavernae]|uniref:Copper amine oxidase n=1 Tax=Peribacillus cavernae TaxID=1674310 RepID=A0A3S0UA64_9BACI|nr:copper amine oxidase [Peribacillus cavernae]MDQ0219723.1 putative dehydrogenase [Peribacillus cavernae]RUQ25998.1 copper amine oxidase [Peribacillus cavernae]